MTDDLRGNGDVGVDQQDVGKRTVLRRGGRELSYRSVHPGAEAGVLALFDVADPVLIGDASRSSEGSRRRPRRRARTASTHP